MRIFVKSYDPKKARLHDKGVWEEARIYKFVLTTYEFVTGYYKFEEAVIAKDWQIESMLKYCGAWKEIELKDVSKICQEYLAKRMGFNAFPWDESSWESYEAYYDWVNPTTLEGKIDKSLRDHQYFTKEFYKTPDWNEAISEKLNQVGYYKLNGNWYVVTKYSAKDYTLQLVDETEITRVKAIFG